MIHDIIKPLEPQFPADWLTDGDIRRQMRPPSNYPCVGWFHPKLRLRVLSAVEVAIDPGQPSKGPEYHISVTKQVVIAGQLMLERCSAEEGKWVLREFGAFDGWEEDNHVPGGKARNYWRTVAENLIGKECACKETEHKVVEGDYEHRPL